ncbi:MAG: DHH family phosphoesterase [Candidatus Helarchaeota archaeon]
MNNLFEYINSIDPKSILISSHINMDPDGLSSAIALSFLLKKFGIKSKIKIYSDNFTLITKKIIEFFNLKDNFINSISNIKPDLIILVDVSNIEIIGNVKDFIINKTPFIIIDHHAFMQNKDYLPIFSIIKEDYCSTSEIIFEVFESLNLELGILEGKILLLGIIYDTKHFIIATNNTFYIINKILSLGIDYKEVSKLLRYPMEYSEKIARLKAGNRAKIYTIENWVLATSEVSSYEASACRGLIVMGADVAIVRSIKNNELRISLRSTQQFYEKTNISMSDISNEIAKMFSESNGNNLTGGGHSSAAGINGNITDKNIIKTIVELIKDKLKNKF